MGPYGGCDFRDRSEGSPSCDDLPPYTQEEDEMTATGDNLIELCKYSFDKRVRLGATNPTIVDPPTYTIEEENRPSAYQNGASVGPCQCSCEAYQGCKYCLTRMMDCRKPSSSWTNNLEEDLLEDGLKVTQFCTQDGYTRVDVKCGCFDCNC